MAFIVILGICLMGIGKIFILTQAFQKGTGNGLACLLIPFYLPIYIITNWDESDIWCYCIILGAILYSTAGGIEALSRI